MEGEILSDSFSDLVGHFYKLSSSLPDKRSGCNTQYSISDIVMSAFSLFFMQNESFLSFQRAMARSQGRNNAQTLFGIDKIPTDNHIRNMLDGIPSESLRPLYNAVYMHLGSWQGRLPEGVIGVSRAHGLLHSFLQPIGALAGQVAIAIDGTQTVRSYEIHCAQCNRQEVVHKKENKTLYFHSCIAPVLVVPKGKHVLSLPPEHIGGQVNMAKQDCELVAAGRWLDNNIADIRRWFSPQTAGQESDLAPVGINILGDDLYAHQPFCLRLLALGLHFVLVCKPDSHKTLYEEVALQAQNRLLRTYSHTDSTGALAKRLTYQYRYANALPLRASSDALLVNWCEITVKNHKGVQVYQNAFISDHPLTDTSVADICDLGRTRWKVENENHNTLKNRGYNFEHNFGHGKEHLTQTFTSLNVLAFLLHTTLDLADQNYQYVRKLLGTRQDFFQHIATLTSYFCFLSWRQLLIFIHQSMHKQLPQKPP